MRGSVKIQFSSELVQEVKLRNDRFKWSVTFSHSSALSKTHIQTRKR